MKEHLIRLGREIPVYSKEYGRRAAVYLSVTRCSPHPPWEQPTVKSEIDRSTHESGLKSRMVSMARMLLPGWARKVRGARLIPLLAQDGQLCPPLFSRVSAESILFGTLMILFVTGCQGMLLVPGVGLADAEASRNGDHGLSQRISLASPSEDAGQSPEQIFEQISPAVAFVGTPVSSGSGVLIEHSYLLTSARVVWPFNAARVFFAEGPEYATVPVRAWDLTADLALLGPIETDIEPVSLVDDSAVEVGSEIHILGYVDAATPFSQPKISQGLLKNVFTWAPIKHTLFEVEITPDEDLLSGILVSPAGDVIGLSSFNANGLGVAGAMTTIVPRLNTLLESPPEPVSSGQTQLTATLLDDRDAHTYEIRAQVGVPVSLTVTGAGGPGIFVLDRLNNYVGEATPDESLQRATLEFTPEEALPLLVTVYQTARDEHQYEIQSSHPLVLFNDPDDGRSLDVGEQAAASLETGGDVDSFSIELKAGERVRIQADSLMLTPQIVPANETASVEALAPTAPDAAALATNRAELVFEASRDAIYRFQVEGSAPGETGGYLLRVERGDVTTAEAAAPEARATPDASARDESQSESAPDGVDPYSESLLTRYGSMSWYETEDRNFAFLYPTDWEERSGDECSSPGATVCFVGGAIGMIITEEDLRILPRSEQDRDGYLDLLWTIFEENASLEVTGFAESLSTQKLPLYSFNLTSQEGAITISRLIFVDEEGRLAFNLTFATATEVYAELAEFVDFIHDSFRFWDVEDRTETAVYHLDRGMYLATAERDAEALEALTRAIEMDPTLVQAYQWRTTIYQRRQNAEAALADLDRLVELEPRKSSHLYARAVFHYDSGNLEDALRDAETAIEVDPDDPENHNMKALVYAEQGNFDRALSEIDLSEEKNGGELEANVLDTRGFIYLLTGEFEKAKADYDAIFEQDLRFSYALIGAGIAYVGVGEAEEGIALIEEGMAELSEEMRNDPDPQLRSLLEMANEILERNG